MVLTAETARTTLQTYEKNLEDFASELQAADHEPQATYITTEMLPVIISLLVLLNKESISAGEKDSTADLICVMVMAIEDNILTSTPKFNREEKDHNWRDIGEVIGQFGVFLPNLLDIFTFQTPSSADQPSSQSITAQSAP